MLDGCAQRGLDANSPTTDGKRSGGMLGDNALIRSASGSPAFCTNSSAWQGLSAIVLPLVSLRIQAGDVMPSAANIRGVHVV